MSMSIASELLTLNTAKQNIKQAIMDKGVDMAGVPFTNYHAKIAEIEGGGGGEEPHYTRPADWLPLPEISVGEQKVALLYPVFEGLTTNAAYITVAGNFTVDWGDGVAENYTGSTSTSRSHTYNWEDIPASTYCSRGYRQVIITVTPQEGYDLTYLYFSSGSYPARVKYIDIKLSAPQCTQLIMTNCRLLEQVEYIGTNNITGTNSRYMFQYCYSLQNIVSLNTSTFTSFANMFQDCYSLKEIPLLDTSNVTTFANAFNTCYSLKEIPAFNTINVTVFSYAFQNCYSLKDINCTHMNNSTIFVNSFYNCYNLEKFSVANPPAISFSFSTATQLSRSELINLFNRLPTAESATITITATSSMQLSDADKAIATAKGWAVSG